MFRVLRILKSQFRALSLAEFLSLIFGSIYRSDPLFVYMIDIGEETSFNEMSLDDAIVRKGSISELDSFRSHMTHVPWELHCHEYDGVGDFFIAHQADRLQHITWVYTSAYRNRILKLREDEAEFKFSLTLPEYRGRGLQPRVYTHAAEYLGQRGFRRVFACVHTGNGASIRGMEKAGFRRVLQTRLRQVLGVQVSKRIDTSRIRDCEDNQAGYT